MIDIKAKLDASKESRIRIAPVLSNRASELGHPCLRYLVYQRTRWQDKIPHSVELQYIFDEGNRIEQSTIDDFNAAGIRVISQQKDLYWKAYNITGHIDGRIDDPPNQVPIEIKSINPFDFPKLFKIEDFQRSTKVWIRKIPTQINLYLLLEEEEHGYLILRDKLSAQIKPIYVTLDLEIAEAAIQKAVAIENHIKENTLPDRINDEKIHSTCPFYHICLPEQFNPDKLLEDPELESKIEMWFALKENISRLEKEFKPIDESIKEQLKGKEARIGDWLVSGKWIHLAERKMKATDYWRMEIKSLLKVVKIEPED